MCAVQSLSAQSDTDRHYDINDGTGAVANFDEETSSIDEVLAHCSGSRCGLANGGLGRREFRAFLVWCQDRSLMIVEEEPHAPHNFRVMLLH
jgi:hypothetical protein